MIALLSRLSLDSLSICYNGELVDKPAFCRAVSEVIRNNPNLTELNLEGNLLTDDDIPLLFPQGTRGVISQLSLQNNALSKKSDQYFQDWAIPSVGRKRGMDDELSVHWAGNPISSTKEISSPLQEGKNLTIEEDDEISPQVKRGKNETIEVSSEREQRFSLLLATQFTIQKIPSDHNCLFHACAEEGETHQELRKRTCDYMEAHFEDFMCHMEDDMIFPEHVALMRKEGTWGGDKEIAALSRLLNRPIAVYSKEYPLRSMDGKLLPIEFNIYKPDGVTNIFAEPRTLYLYRINGNHFHKLLLTRQSHITQKLFLA